MDRPSFESPIPEASELALAEYNCDGSVWTRGLLKDVVEPYASMLHQNYCRANFSYNPLEGSIIGCGISPNPDTVFFTKDGRLICGGRPTQFIESPWVIEHALLLRHRNLRAQIQI